MYFVYAILSSKNNDLYIGYSEKPNERLVAHNSGRVRSTKPNRPWKLVYYEAYLSKDDARKREYQLKQSYFKNELKDRLSMSLGVNNNTVT